MNAFKFNREEFHRFLNSIDWLRHCEVIWRGDGPLAMVRMQQRPGERERLEEVRFQPGQRIPVLDVAVMFFCVFKGGYRNDALEHAPEPGEALARATALLLNEQARRMRTAGQEPQA